MLQIKCTNCLEILNVPDEYMGRRGTCKKCGGSVDVQTEHQLGTQERHKYSAETAILKKPNAAIVGLQPTSSAPVGDDIHRPAETEVYSDKSIRVTTTRIMIGTTTYALRNVTSVSIREVLPPSGQGVWTCSGIVLLITGGLTLLLGMSLDMEPAGVFVFLILALGPIGLGVVFLNVKFPGPSHSLIISSSSGEVLALTSERREYIEEIIASINEAIVLYR